MRPWRREEKEAWSWPPGPDPGARLATRNPGRWPGRLARARQSARWWLSLAVETALAAAVLAAVAHPLSLPPPAGPPSNDAAVVCGQPSLDSPYDYDGATGSYTSGTPGLPTYGSPSSDFPDATAGDVLPPGTHSYLSFQLAPDTVYYLEPATYIGQIQANSGDAFVGGYLSGTGAVLTGQYNTTWHYSIDSNSSNGDQPGVTIEYLTIEQFEPVEDQAATNNDGNTDWTITHDTFTLNVPGAGLQATTGSVITSDCLTQNGQYGINAGEVNGFGVDPVTGGPSGITISGDEISFNDTCDIEGLLTNTAAGYVDYNPVPVALQNAHCTDQGDLVNDGNWGGFKLWRTNGVLVTGDWIHDNYGVGGWADTDNANTTWADDYISNNDFEGITEEISYNFAVTGTIFVNNDWFGGLGNPSFPQPAVYVSESGSDSVFGGIPACAAPECAGFPAYTTQSLIAGNTFYDNGGGVFLWENAGRYCSSGLDSVCTLADGGAFTLSNCGTNWAAAAVNTSTYAGEITGSPAANWWDGCQWETENVQVRSNSITNTPSAITGCNPVAWAACGANGIFSDYVNPTTAPPWAVGSMIQFYRGNTWSGNAYYGPPNFYAWQQGNPVTQAQWTGPLSAGDMCTSGSETASARCAGPFAEDAGSTFSPLPSGPVPPQPPRPRRVTVIPVRIGRH
jgi:hypothetical protein